MEETIVDRPSTLSIALKYGAIYGIISVLFTLIISVTGGNPYEGKFDWKFFLGIAIALTIIFLAHKEYKDTGDGYMSYGKGLGIGVLVGVFGGVIMVIYTAIYLNFVDPGMMDSLLNKALDDMEAQGQPDEAIEMTRKMFGTFFWGFMIFFMAFFSFIYALIVSLITQKRNPNPAF
jgi:hypothetical protein